MIACGLLLALAWHRGVGECNVSAASGGTTTLELCGALAIAVADIVLCVASRRWVGDRQPWMVLMGLACTLVGAGALVLLVGVNFRGC